MRSLALILLSLAILAGCGQSTATGTAGPAGLLGGLPPLPRDDAPGDRSAMGLSDVVIEGEDYFAAYSGASVLPTGLRISAPAGGLGWAIYQLGGLNTEVYVTGFDLEEASVSGTYWVALANYSLGQWELVATTTNTAEAISIADPQNCISPGGNLYFALLASDSTIIHTRATLHVQDNSVPTADVPTGLLAFPSNHVVSLAWDAYSDLDAVALNIYQSAAPDMTGATVAMTESLPSDGVAAISDLINGTTYYFALKATTGSLESDYSNIVSATPMGGGGGGMEIGGIWGRLGNDAAGTGRTTRGSPRNFGDLVTVDIRGDSRDTGLTRTSPALDSQGNVHVLSRDGFYSSYTGDLANRVFHHDLGLFATTGNPQVCPPQAPLIDADDNVYFVTVDTVSGAALIWGFEPGGFYIFDHPYPSAFSKDSDNERPYPSLNIAGGSLVTAVNTYQYPVALAGDGQEVWRIPDYQDMLEFSAEPVYNAVADTVEWPVTFVGISIDPRRHWMSLHAADGTFNTDIKGFGGNPNLYGGLVMPTGLSYFPEYSRLVLADGAGNPLDTEDFGIDNPSGSPALDATGTHIYQPVFQDEGIVIFGKLGCYEVTGTDPPQLEMKFMQVFDSAPLTGKPAVDKDNNVWFADESGSLYRLSFDPAEVVDDNNPVFLTHRLDDHTFKYSSFALTDGAAYVISEQGLLYRFGNPFTD